MYYGNAVGILITGVRNLGVIEDIGKKMRAQF